MERKYHMVFLYAYLFLGPLLHRRVGELVRLLLGRPRRTAPILDMLLLHLVLLRLLLLLQHMVGVVGRRERGPVLRRDDTGVGGLCNSKQFGEHLTFE